jgi:hypothetical protein
MDVPVFDLIGMAGDVLSSVAQVVVHRNADGEVYCFHSPLEHGPVRCDLCQTPGTRVYLEPQR